MYVDDEPDDSGAEGAEPPPEGWSEDPREMKKRAAEKYKAGDYKGALDILETLYEQGLRFPIPSNIAVCYARMGDLASGAHWMGEALDDPAFRFGGPVPASDRETRAGYLEAYYQWSRGVAHLA